MGESSSQEVDTQATLHQPRPQAAQRVDHTASQLTSRPIAPTSPATQHADRGLDSPRSRLAAPRPSPTRSITKSRHVGWEHPSRSRPPVSTSCAVNSLTSKAMPSHTPGARPSRPRRRSTRATTCRTCPRVLTAAAVNSQRRPPPRSHDQIRHEPTTRGVNSESEPCPQEPTASASRLRKWSTRPHDWAFVCRLLSCRSDPAGRQLAGTGAVVRHRHCLNESTPAGVDSPARPRHRESTAELLI
jgi:hypothetical protein